MYKQKKKCLWEIISDITNFDKKKVFQGFSRNNKLSGNFIVLSYGDIGVFEEEYECDDDVVVSFEETVLVDIYTVEEFDGKLCAERIKKYIGTYEDKLEQNELYFIESSDIQDLSYFIDDKSKDYQYRTRISLRFRYNQDYDLNKELDSGIIENIEGVGFGQEFEVRKEVEDSEE